MKEGWNKHVVIGEVGFGCEWGTGEAGGGCDVDVDMDVLPCSWIIVCFDILSFLI